MQESPENPPAAWLWRSQSEILGASLRVRVGGSFVFPPAGVDMERIERVVLLAGGVGINPLMSMLGAICEGGWQGRVDVLYGSKMPQGGIGEILFLRRMAKMLGERKAPSSIRLFVTGHDENAQSGPQTIDGAEVAVQKGRLSVEELIAFVKTGHLTSSLAYVCGPPAMTDAFVDALTSQDGAGMDKERVMLEKWW